MNNTNKTILSTSNEHLKTERKNFIQILRGISILGVLLIHSISSNSNNNISLIIRQCINYSVPLFLFISGYLVDAEKFKNGNYTKSFYRKRGLRVGIPYLIFSFLFFLLIKDLRIMPFSKKFFYLLTGQTDKIYYYIIVYLQFLIITPFLVKMLNKINPVFIYSISFLTILLQYSFVFLQHPFKYPYNCIFSLHG